MEEGLYAEFQIGTRGHHQRFLYKGTQTWTTLDHSLSFKFAIRFEHCIRINCNVRNNFAYRWQLVSGLQSPQAQRVLHLFTSCRQGWTPARLSR